MAPEPHLPRRRAAGRQPHRGRQPAGMGAEHHRPRRGHPARGVRPRALPPRVVPVALHPPRPRVQHAVGHRADSEVHVRLRPLLATRDARAREFHRRARFDSFESTDDSKSFPLRRLRLSTRAFTPSPSATSARRTARLVRLVPTATPRRPLPSRRTASSSPRRRRRRRVRRTTPTPIPTPPPLRIAPRRRSRTSACRSLCARRSRRSGSRNRRCPSARLSLTSSRAATSRFSRTREAGRRWRTSFPSSRGS